MGIYAPEGWILRDDVSFSSDSPRRASEPPERTSGGLVEFFGPNDHLFASAPLDDISRQGTAPYTWNGWIADFPITHIRVSSAGILEGFLGYDDLQVTFIVPSPGGLLLFLVPLARGPRRRHR